MKRSSTSISKTVASDSDGNSGSSLPAEIAERPGAKRYARYKSVIDCVCRRDRFLLSDIKTACYPEQPGFVTRLVNDLVNSGWVIREAEGGKDYRWNPSRTFSPVRWIDEKIFGSQIKASPLAGRPRERLLDQGAELLSNSELIAILVRSGRPGESAVMAGQKIAKEFDGRLEDLPGAGRGELKSISCAIEKTAYCQMMAGIELGRRIAALSDEKITIRINSSSDAIAFCERFFQRLVTDRKQEEFHIVTLDTKNQVIDTHQITVGTLDASLVHPREVFRAAIKDAASSIILVHNHPSGDPTPSQQDLGVTQRLQETGELIGIEVLDHIVLGKNRSVSIQEST
ncbi:DNA repair protein RadC [Mariniblastus sp.]|nr:DNA repair protein RadC [Mariniblastus sp.]MDA7887676.1 DNA repair protein RadC [bacterium]MDA7903036.1 DNA repair protein RadC [Mariniblastus sp.]MDA7904294.1 DNA repair protein RadC [bacterium]MDA7925900.1 DNA repair protein RadC [Mariniblastus sp.]